MLSDDLREMVRRDAEVVDPGKGRPPPGSARWNAQFGRGWTVGILLGMIGLVAGIVVGSQSAGSAGGVRAFSTMIASFAMTTLYCLTYLVRYGIGFVWFSQKDGSPNVIWPDERPTFYFCSIGAFALLALVALLATVWVFINADVLTQNAP